MNIQSIKIQNYRSIKNVAIDLSSINEKKASILIGLNESGKSNILKAVSLSDKEKTVEYSVDANKELKKNGDPIIVTFSYRLEPINFITKELSEDGFPEDIVANIKVNSINRYVKFDKSSNRTESCHIFTTIEETFFKEYLIDYSSYSLVNIKDVYQGNDPLTEENVDELVGEEYGFASRLEFEKIIEKRYITLIGDSAPKIIFWRSADDKYLINKPIDLNLFKSNQENAPPLKNIFHIAGVQNIAERISSIEEDEEERFELEGELSDSITTYINQVWKEHNINIKVRIEDMQCQVSVEDKDNTKAKFKMGQRSDGFKQFISILLNLSAENEAQTLQNKIIILDEPEVHLHPSGVKYLRDELLKISMNNQIIIATHSIHMVDKLTLNRHFQVKKEKSVTEVLQIKPDNPYQEEVIYEALGTSIFEHIKPNALVLEGKTDKDIFDAFTQKFRTEIKPLNLSAISADGVDNIVKYVKFFDGKLVKGYVLVDSDADGIRIRDAIISQNRQFSKKNVFDINTICAALEGCTMEDMLPRKLVVDSVEKIHGLTLELDETKACMAQIKQKLRDKKKFDKKDNLKNLKTEITNRVLKDLSKASSTKAKVKEEYPLYYKFLIALHKKLKSC